MSQQELVDAVAESTQEIWKLLEISYDQFVRTTDPGHEKLVRELLSQVHAKGDIYFARYSGLYCTGCERFLTEKELVDGKCPDHQRPPTLIEEENYFFRMTKYFDRLR